jgi:hypothetical protein
MAMRVRSEILLLGALACATAAAVPRRGSPVIEIKRQVDNQEPVPISIQAVPIVDVDARVPLPAAAPAKGDACARLNCNANQNSRLPAAVPQKPLQVRWAVPFAPSFAPTTVLQDGDRVLAYGGTVYRLYDLDGKMISEGRTGSSGVVLDSAHGQFYFININGYLAAHKLEDGAEEFDVNPSPKDAWPFLARRGSSLFNLALEMPQPWKNVPPNSAILERFDLPASLQLDDKIVLNLTGSAALHFATANVKIAMGEERLVLGLPGSIVLSSIDLHPSVRLDGDFTPLALSQDELGRVHLVVRSGDQTALWVLTPTGQRTAKVVFKPEYGAPFGQPIVGYDHRIFLLHSGLTAYDAYGDLLWERWLKGRVAGAGVTTDGQLLVSGGDLAAYDEKGERRLLFMLPGVSFVTPPSMSAKGEIFVASKDTVYCLTPRKE